MNDYKFGQALRAATRDDVDLIFKWANDTTVRKNSFNKAGIPYEEHKAWYEDKMKSKSTLFYILMFEDKPAGQIRLELEGDFAQINYSIAKEFRGRGLGKAMIELAEEKLKLHYPQIKKMIAEVKPENSSSQKIFEKSGYEKAYIAYEKVFN